MTQRADKTLSLDEARQALGISVPTAAKLAGVSTNAMYSACERGEVPSLRLCGRIIVQTAPFMRLFGLDVDDKTLSDLSGRLDSGHAQKCGSCGKGSS